MLNEMKKAIEEHSLINKNDVIVVGLSGGPDSVSMIHALNQLKETYNLKICAVHLNHMIRGAEANGDQMYAEMLCKNMGIEIFSFKKDIPEISKKLSITEEEAGRKIRYELFEKVCKDVKCNKIAVAQNKNDQVETFLMRVIRGAGLDGLSSIKHIRDNKFIRPLLSIDRTTIEKYCEDNGLEPRTDKTNFQSIYLRNKIRLDLIPMLKKDYNTNIIDTIYRTTELIQMDYEFIDNFANEIFEKMTKNDIDIEYLDKLHKAILSRVIRKLIEREAGNIKDVSYSNVNEVICLINKNVTGKYIIIKGVKFLVEYNKLRVIINKDEDVEVINMKITLGENIVEVKDDLRYKINLEIVNGNNFEKGNKFVEFFDYDKIVGDIYAINRIEGDKFKPIGMMGKSQKIKDYFINEKISNEIRGKILILRDKNEIIWVVGHRISEEFKIDKNTLQMLKVTVELL